jgi:2-amino-4-hydroxy-6-hydroxymethyldihydropteridine diphosphokinase
MIEHDYHLYISLGSNLGSRADNIMSCVKYINHHPRIQVKIQSEIIETLSIINCQQNYYNTVLLIQTNIFIFDLLEYLLRIEDFLGRVKSTAIPWSSRTIDIDLLYLQNNNKIFSNSIIIPHPELLHRPFLLYLIFKINPSQKIINKNVAGYIPNYCNNDILIKKIKNQYQFN